MLESFFWLLDVMQPLSREILLDEAVNKGRNHGRGNASMQGDCSPCVGWHIKCEVGVKPDTLMPSKQCDVSVKYV